MPKQYDSWNLIQLEKEAKSMRRYRIVKGLVLDLLAACLLVALIFSPVFYQLFFKV